MRKRYQDFLKDSLGKENPTINCLFLSSVCLPFPRTIEQEKNIVREGLYRQNGNMADIQTLRLDFFQDDETPYHSKCDCVSRYAIEENKLDKLDAVNSVYELTGVVKLFFRFLNVETCAVAMFTPCLIRELREPLIPWSVIILMKKELEKEKEEKQQCTKQVIKGFLSISFMNKYSRYLCQG